MDEIFTTGKTAEILKVKPKTLENWRLAGRGPDFIRVGGKYVRYSRPAIEAYLKSRTIRCMA